jgi:hypothetical protein
VFSFLVVGGEVFRQGFGRLLMGLVFGARSMVVVVAVVLSSIIIINGFGALL